MVAVETDSPAVIAGRTGNERNQDRIPSRPQQQGHARDPRSRCWLFLVRKRLLGASPPGRANPARRRSAALRHPPRCNRGRGDWWRFRAPEAQSDDRRERSGRRGRTRNGGFARPVRFCRRADNGCFRERHRRYVLDRGARFAERFGAACVTGLGAWSRIGDVRHRFFWNNDTGQRGLGSAGQ